MPETAAPTADRYVDYLPLDDIQLARRNPKGHDDELIEGSVRNFGLVELPTMDERTGRLVAGHGRLQRLKALRDAGEAPPKRGGVQVSDDGTWSMGVLRGWSSESDEDAEAYLITSNTVGERGGIADDALLTEMLGSLDEAHMLELTGYSQMDLDDLRAALEEPLPPVSPAETPLGGAREPDALERQTRQTRGLDDLADDYAASTARVLVLAYPGPRYVWVVGKLAGILKAKELENNSDALLALLEDVTGENAPAADAFDG
jgi:hypothetical protein